MSTRLQQSLLLRPLQTPDDLHRWVRLFCNINVPRTPVYAGHSAPFDYLVRAYFEPASDQVVHAPRGGGKTRLAAIATLLDVLHKPGISVRILGGSFEQSLRMWEHLVPDLTHAARELIKKRVGGAKRINLGNGSSVAVLTQSERSVRGLRVQKLRCDEVELFKPEVWEAAQLVTKSREYGARSTEEKPSALRSPHSALAHGAIDALSTLHEPFGLMQKIIDDAERTGTPIVRWCLLDVLERCAPERECASCPLFDDCGGVAKTRANGFVSIDDAIRMKKRVSLDVWQSEMLCQRPSVTRAVFPSFDRSTHVRESIAMETPTTSLAIDFGYRNPFVCLWVQFDGTRTYVIDEYVQDQRTIDDHILEMRARPWKASHIACDPAGSGRNEQTGVSSVQQLRRAGFSVRHKPSRIVDGVEQIRAAFRPASGEPTLFMHPRCVHLIRSLIAYHYSDIIGRASELPVKDGQHDHLIDALRYHFVNATRQELTQRTY
jgi:hypothetical protein